VALDKDGVGPQQNPGPGEGGQFEELPPGGEWFFHNSRTSVLIVPWNRAGIKEKQEGNSLPGATRHFEKYQAAF
jgi:hypothetical protein